MDYYDFDLREFFDVIDENGDGIIDFNELIEFVKRDLGESYSILDKKRRLYAKSLIEGLADFIL